MSQANDIPPNQNTQTTSNKTGDSPEPSQSRINTDESQGLQETGESAETSVSQGPSSIKHSLPEAEREVQLSITDEHRQIPCQMISADGHIYMATVCKNQVEVEHFQLRYLQRFV